VDKSGKVVAKDDLKAQATQAFENLKTALAAAGATFNDVVKLNWYVKGYKPEMLPALREARAGFVNKEHPPASTLIGVVALAQDDYQIEIEAIAIVATKDKKK
jgi:2-iminobutanoate/2-iminopropanoate deaminase